MKEQVQSYCDGAAMAYEDCAALLRGMIKRAPVELRPMVNALLPVAAAYEQKAKTVHTEARHFLEGTRQ